MLQKLFFDFANIKMHSEECTVSNSRIEEVLYDPLKSPKIFTKAVQSFLISHFEFELDLDLLESYSFQLKDDLTYFEDRLILSFRNSTVKLAELGVKLSRPHPDYSMDFNIHSKSIKYKFFDKDHSPYDLPIFPIGSKTNLPYGIGVFPESNRRDVYFTNSNLRLVESHFKTSGLEFKPLTEHIDQDNTVNKLFGLAFNHETLEPLKIKRYIYPSDPYLAHVLFDEELRSKDEFS